MEVEVLKELARLQGGRLILDPIQATILDGSDYRSIVIDLALLNRDLDDLIVGAQEVLAHQDSARGVAGLLNIYLHEVAPLGPRSFAVRYDSFGFVSTEVGGSWSDNAAP